MIAAKTQAAERPADNPTRVALMMSRCRASMRGVLKQHGCSVRTMKSHVAWFDLVTQNKQASGIVQKQVSGCVEWPHPG